MFGGLKLRARELHRVSIILCPQSPVLLSSTFYVDGFTLVYTALYTLLVSCEKSGAYDACSRHPLVVNIAGVMHSPYSSGSDEFWSTSYSLCSRFHLERAEWLTRWTDIFRGNLPFDMALRMSVICVRRRYLWTGILMALCRLGLHGADL